MKKIGVHKKLNDIGMSVFIEFFNEFKAYANSEINKDELYSILKNKKNYTHRSCLNRINVAERIFKENEESEALDIIINSVAVSDKIKNNAKKLLI